MKKIILAICFLFIATTVTANDITEESAANTLVKLGIIKGYSDGSLKLERSITRSEVTTLLVRVLETRLDTLEIDDNLSFDDVTKDYWAYENINKAYVYKIVSGYPDNTFRPQNNVTNAEIITLLVRLAEKDKELEGEWPYNYVNKAIEIGVIENDAMNMSKPATRGYVFRLLYKAVFVEI